MYGANEFPPFSKYIILVNGAYAPGYTKTDTLKYDVCPFNGRVILIAICFISFSYQKTAI